MAGGKALNVRMNFQVDTTQAQQQLKGLYSQLNQLTSASAFGRNSQLGITQEIIQATKAATQLKSALSEAMNPLTGNLNLSAFNDQLIASKMSLMDYRTQLSSLGTAGNQAFNTLTRSIMTAETPLLRTGKAAQTMWTVLGNTVRWQATSSILHGIMSTASKAMGYVQSLDRSLNNIRIVTGQSEAQMARFAKTANQAAKELNTSTNEYAKASLIYYQQGLSNKQVEERTRATIKLANVAGQSAKTVSDQMTAVWNNFYDGSKSLEYYADVITALGASTASSSEEIAKGLQKFSSIAQTTGLSYEYATSALSTVVAATRQSADSVGTSFKTLFSRLQGLSLGEVLDDGTTLNKYSQALNTVGVNIKKANGDLKDMDTILDELGNKWSNLGQDTKIALAQTVGGVRNYTGLMSLMDHWDEFQVNLKTAQTAQGTLQNQADIYAESWQAASNHVKAASETIYKNLLDDKFFKGLTNMFGYMLDGIGEVTNQMGGFQGVMSGIANFAFRTFAPQITKSFANIGSTLYGLTPQGQERVLDLRRQAMNAVTADVRLSQYDQVDKLAHSYNQAFVDRQVAYDEAVAKGRISEYQQPVYQQLFSNMSQQEDALIRQAETYYANQEMTNLNAGRLATAANAAIVRRGQQNQEAQTELSGWKDPALQEQIQKYRTTFAHEENAANLLQYYRGEGTYGIQTKNMVQAAQSIQQMALGAKALGQDLDKTLPGLGQFHTQLETLGGDVTKLTQDQLKGLLDENTVIGKFLETATRNSDDEVASTALLKDIESSVIDRLKLDVNTTEGKDTLNSVMAAVTAKDLSLKEQAALLQKAGLNEQQIRGVLGDVKGAQAPQTMAMSSALATNMGALASLGQIYGSVTTAVKTFGDENATAGQQVASLTSLFMAGSMAVQPFKNFMASAGKQVTVFGKELGITNGTLGLVMAGLAATAVVASAVAKDLHKTSFAGTIENYNTALATSIQLANDAKGAYENLVTVSGTHNNLLRNLSGMRQGTEEFTLALLQANEAAEQVIESNNLIFGQDYTYSDIGAITFTPGRLEEVIEQNREDMVQASIGQQQMRYAKQILDTSIQANKEDLGKDYLDYIIDNTAIKTAKGGTPGTTSLMGIIRDLGAAVSDYATYEEINGVKTMHLTPEFENYISEYLQGGWFVGAHDSSLTGARFNQEDLYNALGVTSIDDASKALSDLLAIQVLGNAEDMNAYFAGTGYKSSRQLQNEAAIQGLVGVTLSNQENMRNKDLISSIVSSNLLKENNAIDLLSAVNAASIDTFLTQSGKNAKEWYQALYGENPVDLSEEEISTKVSQGLINEIILNGSSSSKGIFFEENQLNALNFKGANEIAEELKNINLPTLDNLRYGDIATQFDKLLTSDAQHNEYITNYKEQAQRLYNTQLKDLQDAMWVTFTDSALESVQQGITDQTSEQFRQELANIVGTEANTLTYGALKAAVNAMTNANTVGIETGQYMRQLLAAGRQENGTFDADTLAVIRNFNYDNTLNGLYANNQLQKYGQNEAQRAKYQALFAKQIEDIGKEKGFFQMLYNSSGFADVMDNLRAEFESAGKISAQYVTDLASKSEDLAYALKIGNENADKLNVNAGGIAGIFEEITRGTLSTNLVTSELVSAMSTARSSESANAEAFEILDNLDLGRSGLEFLSYFQDMGKVAYTAEHAGWGFYSEPLQNIVKLIGNQEVKDAYAAASANGSWSFQQMWDSMPDYFTGFLDTMAGKKGKGKGGTAADVWSYIYDSLENLEGFGTEEFWDNLGFRTDENGRFWLRDNDNTYGRDKLEAQLTQALKNAGFDEESAKNMASIAYGTVATSGGTGVEIQHRDAMTGYETMLKAGTPQSEAALRAYYNANQAALYNDFKNADAFIQDYKNQGGSIGYAAANAEEWEGITTVSDLVAKAREAGTITSQYARYQSGRAGGHFQEGPVQGIRDLAATYGAYDQLSSTWDYDKLVKMIESMNGTEEDLIEIMENSPKYFEDAIYGKNKYGQLIQRAEDETIEHFVSRLNAATSYDNVANRQGYNDITAGIGALWWTNPLTGESVFDPTGTAQEQYNSIVSDAAGKKANGSVGGEKGFSGLSSEEMDAIITDTQTKLQQRVAAGEYLSDVQQKWLQIADNGLKDENGEDLGRAATNKLLTNILYNTDEIRDSNGEMVEYASKEDEQAALNKKSGKTAEEEGYIDPETGELVLPSKQETQTAPSGSGWDGNRGAGTGQQTPIRSQDYQRVITAIGNGNVGLGLLLNSGVPMDQVVDVLDKQEEAVAANSKAQTGPYHLASGQNNNLLAFASGKEEGHIALTGELGPELRIKEDGSAELLGKQGREYAWVNPTDTIYTANQTASILGSNNIPALEGLAKGINNFIPAYADSAGADWNASASSHSGGGGGGGGGEEEKDPRYDPNTLKIRDILERYYTILQQLDDITRAVEHISKVVDRGWGQERIEALKEQTALYEKQLAFQEKYVNEIKEYVTTDKSALTTMISEFVTGYNEGKADSDKLTWSGAEFDENGVLTNYKDFVTKLVDQYNANAEENAKDKEAQYKFQEQLKDIQFYTESLNLYETESEKLYDLRNQILDNKIKTITYAIENENELDANELRIINAEMDKIKRSAFEAAESIALISEKMEYSKKSLDRYGEGIFDILGEYSNPELVDNMRELFVTDTQAFFDEWKKLANNPEFQDLTTEHAQQLEQWLDQMETDLKDLRDNFDAIIDTMGDKIKDFGRMLDSEVDEFDFFDEMMTTYQSILDLTNRSTTGIDAAFMTGLNAAQLDNALNKLKGARREQESMTRALANANAVLQDALVAQAAYTGDDADKLAELQLAVDKSKENFDKVNEQYESATTQFAKAWEDTLNKITDNYKKAVEEAAKEFEKSFSPMFQTFELLEAQFDREKALGDLYVKDYQRLHDLSKLNRDIQNSIMDTDNLKSKERLRDLQKEINDLQDNGVELSEYDLDILDKKYKLELARQALEDARDAKSLVRLSRDNNGNWGYVYTSNEDEVAEAEQNYEDAIREMEEANENYINNIQEQIVNVQKEAENAILSLQPEDFATYDDYLATIQNIQNQMFTTLDYLRMQMNNAFGNQLYLDPAIIQMYGTNNHNLTDNFGDTILAGLLSNNNLDSVIQQAKDSWGNTMLPQSLEAFTSYSEKQAEAWADAGHDINNAAQVISDAYATLGAASEEQVGKVEQVADRIDDAFQKQTDAIRATVAELDNLINKYEIIEQMIRSTTDFLKISNDYVPAEKVDFIEAIDSWDELAEIEKAFKENGNRLGVVEKDAEGNRKGYDLDNETLYKAQVEEWRKAIATKEAIDVGDVIDPEEYERIKEYLDKHGIVMIIDKDGNHLIYSENDPYLVQAKKDIEAAQNAVKMVSNGTVQWSGLTNDIREEILKEVKGNPIYDKDSPYYVYGTGFGTKLPEDHNSPYYVYGSGFGDTPPSSSLTPKSNSALYKLQNTINNQSGYSSWSQSTNNYVPVSSNTGVTKTYNPSGYSSWGAPVTTTTTTTTTTTSTPRYHMWNTGGYTGRWQSALTGMYTGEWDGGSVDRNGRLAWLHQKELVLNAHDTENFLDAMEIVRQLDNLTNWMANGLGDLFVPNIKGENSELEQNVHIEASFPNVTNHSEIEMAFDNLVNRASQYANRK